MTTSTHTVSGMTCGHCVQAVTKEVQAIENVSAVTVDLESGTVTVESDGDVDAQALRDAVDEAGYTLVS